MYDKLNTGDKLQISDNKLKVMKTEGRTEIIGEVYIADTFSKRLMGYMLRKNPHKKAIFFSPCNSIHTFFMRFNIDVIFLNKEMEIVSIIKDLKPWKAIMPIKKAVSVIEIPS